jgi:hypothetical protein
MDGIDPLLGEMTECLHVALRMEAQVCYCSQARS